MAPRNLENSLLHRSRSRTGTSYARRFLIQYIVPHPYQVDQPRSKEVYQKLSRSKINKEPINLIDMNGESMQISIERKIVWLRQIDTYKFGEIRQLSKKCAPSTM
jgi:hypothetical protein